MVYKTTRKGWKILNRKGTTYYGIATACAGVMARFKESAALLRSLLCEDYGKRR